MVLSAFWAPLGYAGWHVKLTITNLFITHISIFKFCPMLLKDPHKHLKHETVFYQVKPENHLFRKCILYYYK